MILLFPKKLLEDDPIPKNKTASSYLLQSHLKPMDAADPGKAAADPDEKTLWYDCSNCPVEGKGWPDTESFYDRLPSRANGKVTKDVWNLSHNTAGFCFRFTTDAESIKVRWTLSGPLGMHHMPPTGASGFDLYARNEKGKWQFRGNGQPVQETNSSGDIATFPGREHLLYLPLYNGIKLFEIGIAKEHGITFLKMSGNCKPLVFYGTSITQGGCASRPGLAYTAIVGRHLDIPVINLGFSGSGKMEMEMGDLLSELDPSIYVLDTLWNMTPEMVGTRIEPFVRRLRTAHGSTPIVIAEDCNFLDASPTEKGKILRSVFAKMQSDGIPYLHFLSNKNMLGDDSESTVDCCHPNDIGMMRLASVFSDFLPGVLRISQKA